MKLHGLVDDEEITEFRDAVKFESQKTPGTHRFPDELDHREAAMILAFARSRQPTPGEMYSNFAFASSVAEATKARDSGLLIAAILEILEMETGKEQKGAWQTVRDLVIKHKAEGDPRKLAELVLAEMPGSLTYRRPVNAGHTLN